MRSKEELESIRTECEELSRKLAELSEDELKDVTAGSSDLVNFIPIILLKDENRPGSKTPGGDESDFVPIPHF